ncbi:hypothetical protein N431DRAFT_452672 [Stipitochalara longipes BDJ]|nr:hypothetical protein N431DRAFT_452672 [Stipitochalara longipes BDJ]
MPSSKPQKLQPLNHATLAERQAMLTEWNFYVSEDPNNLELLETRLKPKAVIVRSQQSKPRAFISRNISYTPYQKVLDHAEINPEGPADSFLESRHLVGPIGRAEHNITLVTFICSLLIFLYGKLDSDLASKLLPTSYHGDESGDIFPGNVNAVKAQVSTVRTKMLKKSLLPIVLHWLRDPDWIEVDAQGNFKWEFSSAAERMAYWRHCLRKNPWLSAWWMTIIVGGLMDIIWTFSSKPAGPVGEQLRNNILEAIDLRLLKLADVLYMHKLDVDLTSKVNFKGDNVEISYAWSNLKYDPEITAVEPKDVDWPVLRGVTKGAPSRHGNNSIRASVNG